VEVDSLYIENVSCGNQSFREVLSPLPEKKPNDFTRNKMIRVYWKEIPPVAGIQVFHHFEINMFPLLIQMTYGVGKSFLTYFFPNIRAGTRDVGKIDNKSDASSVQTTPEIGSRGRALQALNNLESTQDIKLMQTRASQNKSFIYIKVPGVNHCISYKVIFRLNFSKASGLTSMKIGSQR
jgi:hypothetical protein